MPLTAFLLALGAAVLHATWNVLLAGARDSEAATAVATLAGVVLLAPVALATGGVSDAALPFAAASAALHVAYLALLARAYVGGEVSVVYPVSRGTAPVLVLIFGAIVLGEDATAAQAAGVAGVSAHARLARRDLLFGIGIAMTIAAYTLVDAEGVDHARAPAYLFLLLAPSAAVYAAAMALGGHASQMRDELRPQAFLIGACIVGAYGSVLAALRLASAAPVAAVRESSVVIATLLAAAFLHERVDGRRLSGALLVVAGVAAIALG